MRGESPELRSQATVAEARQCNLRRMRASPLRSNMAISRIASPHPEVSQSVGELRIIGSSDCRDIERVTRPSPWRWHPR